MRVEGAATSAHVFSSSRDIAESTPLSWFLARAVRSYGIRTRSAQPVLDALS
jgi:hypothetical protein